MWGYERRNSLYIKATNREEHKKLDCIMCFYARLCASDWQPIVRFRLLGWIHYKNLASNSINNYTTTLMGDYELPCRTFAASECF